jgi:four helix bundle protein
MDLVCEIYRATTRFPDEEMFGLTAQMRSTAIRVTSKIAEGSNGDARGALLELETQIIVAARLEYLPRAVGQRLYKLVRKLEPAVAVFPE